MLYMGYVGFSVAFAFALAALLSGHLDAAWARWSRPWTLAAWSATELGNLWLWPLCLVGWLHVAWLLLHALAILFVPWPSWQQSWRLSIMALVIFMTYDPYEIRAMGVFRFPTRWLRPIVVRWVLVTSVMMMLAFATSAAWPSPRAISTLRENRLSGAE